jgi:hypothetical protein
VLDGFTRPHPDFRGARGQPGEEGADAGGAGRDLGETVIAVGVGEGFERCAFNADTGLLDIIAAACVQNAALDCSRRPRPRSASSPSK